MDLSEIFDFMLPMPDGSVIVGTREQIQELESLPEDQREKRLKEMEAARDKKREYGSNS